MHVPYHHFGGRAQGENTRALPLFFPLIVPTEHLLKSFSSSFSLIFFPSSLKSTLPNTP